MRASSLLPVWLGLALGAAPLAAQHGPTLPTAKSTVDQALAGPQGAAPAVQPAATPAAAHAAQSVPAAPAAPGAPGAPAAKAPAIASKAAPRPAASGDEPQLIFDREVFSFPSGGRRDPYTPLVGKNDAGPRFEDLSIRGIIYSLNAESMVLLSDGKKTYRKHRGEMVGNARVVEISPTRVIFSVDNFGVWREEALEMKKATQGAKG